METGHSTQNPEEKKNWNFFKFKIGGSSVCYMNII